MRYLGPLASRYGSILVQLALVTLVTRALSLESAGTYFVISGLVLSLYFLVGLGIPDGLVAAYPRELAAGRKDLAVALLRVGQRYSTLSAFVIAALLGLAVLTFTGSVKLAVASTAWLLGYCMAFVAAQALIALGNIQSGSFVFYSAINAALCLTTVPYLFFANSPDLESTASISAAAASAAGVATAVYASVQVRKIDSRPMNVALNDIWVDGAAMAAGRAVQAAIIWSPVWIAGLILTDTDSAHIGLACRLMGVVGAVLAAVRFSIRPQIAQLAASGEWLEIERLDRRIAFWATALAVCALVGAATVGQTLIPLVFGAGYESTSLLLLVFLGACIVESLGGPVDEILKMTGNARSVLMLQVAALVVLAASGTALAKLFGAIGIAWAFVFALSLLYGGQIALLYKARRIVALPGMARFA